MRSIGYLIVALALAAAACGDTASPESVAGSCNVGTLNLVAPGVLTIGTSEPAFPPWVIGDDPTNQQGFESAVAYAVAGELGFDSERVVWIRPTIDEVTTLGPRSFDFDIRQHVIDAAIDDVVDFSSAYYAVKKAIVGLAGSPVEAATVIEDLRPLRLGAVGGANALYIDNVIESNEKAELFETNAAAKAALDEGSIDGIVYDMPAAWFITSVEMPDALILAQIDGVPDDAARFGLVTAERSPVADCLNAAIAVLAENGTLASLETTWLAREGAVRTIAVPDSQGVAGTVADTEADG